MFTSRAEYRLLLRQDNADERLTEIGYELGCVDADRLRAWQHKVGRCRAAKDCLSSFTITPGTAQAAAIADCCGTEVTKTRVTGFQVLSRPHVQYHQLRDIVPGWVLLEGDMVESLEIDAKYSGYLERQQSEVNKLKAQECLVLPEALCYAKVLGLSNEVRQRLEEVRPRTLGQAGRVSGVTPAALSLLLVHLKRLGEVIVQDELIDG